MEKHKANCEYMLDIKIPLGISSSAIWLNNRVSEDSILP